MTALLECWGGLPHVHPLSTHSVLRWYLCVLMFFSPLRLVGGKIVSLGEFVKTVSSLPLIPPSSWGLVYEAGAFTY